MNTRKQRVVWTPEEINKLAAKALGVYLGDLEFTWAYFAQAQDVLPPERRRVINGRAHITEAAIKAFAQARQELLELCIPTTVTIEKQVLVERPREEILNNLRTEELLKLLATRLAPIIDDLPAMAKRLEKPIPSAANVSSDVARPDSSTDDQRRTKVLLYGFLDGQKTQIIQKASGFRMKLIFKNKPKELSGTAGNYQWCIVMNKIPHAVSNKLAGRYGDRVTIVEGVDAAVQALANIHSRQDI